MDRRRGFSLVEVLVAVLMLAVIVGVSVNGYSGQKRRSEHRSAVANIRALSAAVRNYFYTFRSIPATTTTALTSTTYGIPLRDDRFFAYTVTPGGGSFTMGVSYRSGSAGAALSTYTFNADGVQTACIGVPCVSM